MGLRALCNPSHRRRCQRKGSEHLLGHASITTTLDRYGHLMPGNEAEAVDLLDMYIAQEREASSASVSATRWAIYQRGPKVVADNAH